METYVFKAYNDHEGPCDYATGSALAARRSPGPEVAALWRLGVISAATSGTTHHLGRLSGFALGFGTFRCCRAAWMRSWRAPYQHAICKLSLISVPIVGVSPIPRLQNEQKALSKIPVLFKVQRD